MQKIDAATYENEIYRSAVIKESEKTAYWANFKIAASITLKITVMFICEPFIWIYEFFKSFFKRPEILAGRVVLVTGGANGLGRALSKRFAKENCVIAVADINYKDALRTAAELSKYGFRAEAFKVDVADVKSIEKLKVDIELSLGPVEILVNNAAILPLYSLRGCDNEYVQRFVNVNLLSHLWTVRTFIGGMIERKYGKIICICSLNAKLLMPGTIYNTTKIGAKGFMDSLYEELMLAGQDKFIKTSIVYTCFIATRQSLVDLIIGQNPAHNLIRTPDQAADNIVEGVIKQKRDITYPNWLNLWAWSINNLLPHRIYKEVKMAWSYKVPGEEEANCVEINDNVPLKVKCPSVISH